MALAMAFMVRLSETGESHERRRQGLPSAAAEPGPEGPGDLPAYWFMQASSSSRDGRLSMVRLMLKGTVTSRQLA